MVRTFLSTFLMIAACSHAEVNTCENTNAKTGLSDKSCSTNSEQLSVMQGAEVRDQNTIKPQPVRERALFDKRMEMEAKLKRWRPARYGKDKVSNSLWDGSVPQVKECLDRILKHPDSLQVSSWGAVETNGDIFKVRVIYRAKNSLGVYENSDDVFHLDSDGTVFKMTDYSGKALAFE